MRTVEAALMEQLFRIPDKMRRDVPFRLNKEQALLDAALTGRDIIPKARQLGISTYYLGRSLAACLTRSSTRAVVIAHETKATQRLFDRVKYMYNSIPDEVRPEVLRSSANELTFKDNDSTFYIGTAGGRAFGRGDTITNLHCSEYAFWPDALDTFHALRDCVPANGEISIESTGNGTGNDYYKRCMRASEGGSAYTVHFFSWIGREEYSLSITDKQAQWLEANLRKDWGEDILYHQFGVSLGQLAWRRMMLEEKDFDLALLQQEYPSTLAECFMATSSSLFHRVNYVNSPKWIEVNNSLKVHREHPVSGYVYSLGCDPSGGVGQDNAVIEIFCVDTGEQVAEWVNNRTDPDTLGDIVVQLASKYNTAYVTVEANNHGPVTLNKIRGAYDLSRIYYMDTPSAAGYEDVQLMEMGFRTTGRTKPIMIGRLRSELAHSWIIYSDMLHAELQTFIEHANGKIEAAEGCKDDRVIAAACAAMGKERAGLTARSTKDDLEYGNGRAVDGTLDAIIEELSKKREKEGSAIYESEHNGSFDDWVDHSGP